MKLLNAEVDAPTDFFIYSRYDFDNIASDRVIRSGVFDNLNYPDIVQAYNNGSLDYRGYQNDYIMTGLRNVSPVVERRVRYFERDEDLLEIYRKQISPLLPSRVSCIFAFSLYDTCKHVADYYDWHDGRICRYNLIDHNLNRVSRHNINIVNTYRELLIWAKDRNLLDSFNNQYASLCRHYWMGIGRIDFESFPSDNGRVYADIPPKCTQVWEYLIEGQLKLIEEYD
ncbi:MAG: hypothetical protein PHV17_07670 [Candidatus Omnitrophica bacterium]|nr:hypothetical protein [Candidatus Omnitrophota bacterium]